LRPEILAPEKRRVFRLDLKKTVDTSEMMMEGIRKRRANMSKTMRGKSNVDMRLIGRRD